MNYKITCQKKYFVENKTLLFLDFFIISPSNGDLSKSIIIIIKKNILRVYHLYLERDQLMSDPGRQMIDSPIKWLLIGWTQFKFLLKDVFFIYFFTD